jgi:hypothetical protein
MLNKQHRKTTRLTILLCATAAATVLGIGDLQAQPSPPGHRDPLLLTETNGTTNYLAIVNARTRQVTYVPTGGSGGVSGNAGGVAVSGDLAAVVNFGSSNVSIFARHGNSMEVAHMLTVSSKPVSVAFGNGHLVVLGQTSLESFPMRGDMVDPNSDGSVTLIKGDGTAGQVVTYNGGVIYSETSGDIGWVKFGVPGLIGPSVPVMLPAAPNNDTPLGMVGRGPNVYVTIAHSDLEALIVNGKITSTAVGPTPFKDSSGNLTHAPCWNALSGQFLFSSDSPGRQLLRYLVSDTNIFYDKPALATLNGSPTDLDIHGGLLGVIDGGDGVTSNVSLFDIDSEGELTLRFSVGIASKINGAAIIQ